MPYAIVAKIIFGQCHRKLLYSLFLSLCDEGDTREESTKQLMRSINVCFFGLSAHIVLQQYGKWEIQRLVPLL
jgi:hypothetical protein